MHSILYMLIKLIKNSIGGDIIITISLCMIVKDEEKVIGRCLDSVKGIFDEIIIVDTGSTDKTKEIVSKYTSKIYDFKWIDDFAAARNFSFSKATKEYIFWIDADDIIKESDRIKLLKLKENLNNNVDVVLMKYDLTTALGGNIVCTFPRERLLKREKNFIWHDRVHEYIKLSGEIVNVDISVTHVSKHKKSTRNLDILEKIISEGKELTNRNKFYYARELFINKRYNDAIPYYIEFLETTDGLISNYIDSCLDLAYCYKEKKDNKNRLKALLKSFEFDSPHAETCCSLGYYYKELIEYKKAISWFYIATNLIKPEGNTTSVMHDNWGYVPYMEMCSCYFKLKNYEQAFKCNEKAGQYKRDDPIYLHNKEFFENKISIKK